MGLIAAPFRRTYRIFSGSDQRAVLSKVDSCNTKIELYSVELGKIAKNLDVIQKRYDSLNQRFTNLNRKLDVKSLSLEQSTSRYMLDQIPLVPLASGERIHIAFLLPHPLYWPAMEQVWNVVSADARFDARLFLCGELPGSERSQPSAFAETGVPYHNIFEADIHEFCPHIMLYPTLRKDRIPGPASPILMRQAGYRIALLPFGLDAVRFPDAAYSFAYTSSAVNPWIFFFLSKEQKRDTFAFSPQGSHRGVVTGLPRWDKPKYAESAMQKQSLDARINGRKVIFCNLHYYDKAMRGNSFWATVPDIAEYCSFFAGVAEKHPELFFWVRPHSEFFSSYAKHGFREQAESLRIVLAGTGNILLDEDFDYRIGLMRADCMISDVSSLAVDGVVRNIPVLLMGNMYFSTIFLPSLRPLFDSCYQGNFAYDIERFIDYVIYKGLDYKNDLRLNASHTCLPERDGLSSQRIAEALSAAMQQESTARLGKDDVCP